jgi:hypothetical protein
LPLCARGATSVSLARLHSGQMRRYISRMKGG